MIVQSGRDASRSLLPIQKFYEGAKPPGKAWRGVPHNPHLESVVAKKVY